MVIKNKIFARIYESIILSLLNNESPIAKNNNFLFNNYRNKNPSYILISLQSSFLSIPISVAPVRANASEILSTIKKRSS